MPVVLAADYGDASQRQGKQPPGAAPPSRHRAKLAGLAGSGQRPCQEDRTHGKQNDASVEARVGKRASHQVRGAENKDQPEFLECLPPTQKVLQKETGL